MLKVELTSDAGPGQFTSDPDLEWLNEDVDFDSLPDDMDGIGVDIDRAMLERHCGTHHDSIFGSGFYKYQGGQDDVKLSKKKGTCQAADAQGQVCNYFFSTEHSAIKVYAHLLGLKQIKGTEKWGKVHAVSDKKMVCSGNLAAEETDCLKLMIRIAARRKLKDSHAASEKKKKREAHPAVADLPVLEAAPEVELSPEQLVAAQMRKVIICQSLPFSLFEGPEMRKLLGMLKAPVLTDEAFGRHLPTDLQAARSKVQSALTSALRSGFGCALQTDGFKHHGRSIIGYELAVVGVGHFMLAMDWSSEAKKSKYLVEQLTDNESGPFTRLDDLDLSCVDLMLYDKGTGDIEKLMREYEGCDHIIHLYCQAHGIALAWRYCTGASLPSASTLYLTDPEKSHLLEIKVVLAVCWFLVKYIRKHGVVFHIYKTVVNGRTPTQGAALRWGLCWWVASSVIKCKTEILAMLDHVRYIEDVEMGQDAALKQQAQYFRQLVQSDMLWQRLEEFIAFYKPLADLLSVANKSANTLGDFHYQKMRCVNSMRQYAGRWLSKGHVETVLKVLRFRLEEYDQNHLAAACFFLDPRKFEYIQAQEEVQPQGWLSGMIQKLLALSVKLFRGDEDRVKELRKFRYRSFHFVG